VRAQAGFTLVEFLVATSLMVALTAAVFAAVQGPPDAYAVRSEMSDMHQRLRVAVDTLGRDLVGASGVRPYRWGGTSPDPPGTVKTDTVTTVGDRIATYWLKSDTDAGQLMCYSGGAGADVPVVDHVIALSFVYAADGGVTLDASSLADGPWLPDGADAERWDADLARVRTIAVTLRVQSAIAALRGPAGTLFMHAGTASAGRRWAPDVVARFTVAPRNLNLGS
jgi:type II secretory pathway pseudopilin PulG